MRELKFRMWEEDFGKMFYDVGILNEELHVKLDASGYDNLGDYREFNLMQYTGLKDKNGKEIYEGDLLKMSLSGNTGTGIVRWSDFNNGFRIYKDKHKYSGHLGFNDVDEYEVIGNVYENPELLKEGAV